MPAMSLKKTQLRPRTSRAETERHIVRRHACLEALQGLDCLRNVPTAELIRLIDHCTLRVFAPESEIIGYEQQARHFYLAIKGTLQLRLRDKNDREVLISVLGPGDCVGEGILFGDLFRSVGVFAQTTTHLLQLPLSELRTLLPALPTIHNALRQVYTRRLVESTLARVPMLANLLPLERAILADLVQPAHFPRGSTIIEQGHSGAALYIIEAGQVVVEQQGETVATLKEGNFFGEISLLLDAPHRASVRAVTPTEVLKLPAAEFHRLLEQRPDLERQLRKLIEARIHEGDSMRDNTGRARELVTAVNRGLLRGSHLLVRSPDLCPPDCHLCETACHERHGSTRLHLNGTQRGQFDVLDTCRQCSVGAECVEACPEQAFEWGERGALLINDRCTGCGACVSACPYDAVTRVALHNGPGSGPLWALFDALRKLKPRPTIPLEPARPTHRADKCDLCAGHIDLACRTACPTGSLKLVPVEELFPL
jgi:CRP-like cAMP-binding protein/Fe-S-cluster-containing hydrogenase component 2